MGGPIRSQWGSPVGLTSPSHTPCFTIYAEALWYCNSNHTTVHHNDDFIWFIETINNMSDIASKSNRLTSTDTVFSFNSFVTQIYIIPFFFTPSLCVCQYRCWWYISFSLCWHMWDVLADTSVALEPQRKSILQEKARNKVLLFLSSFENLYKMWPFLGKMSWRGNNWILKKVSSIKKLVWTHSAA